MANWLSTRIRSPWYKSNIYATHELCSRRSARGRVSRTIRNPNDLRPKKKNQSQKVGVWDNNTILSKKMPKPCSFNGINVRTSQKGWQE